MKKEKQEKLYLGQTLKMADEIKKLTYSQDWTAYNLAKTKEKSIAENMLIELLDFYESKLKKDNRGYSFKEKIYCMFIYNYTGYSSRRCISELQSAKERGIISHVPHFNSVLNFFNEISILEILKKLILITALPLKDVEKDFAIDSSGFSTCIYDRWLDVRFNKVKKVRHWKKCHIMIGVKTNIITSVKVTEAHRSDSLEYIPLARMTNGFFDIREISADKAYLSVANMEETTSLGAIPYIPFKINSVRKNSGSLIWSRMYDYFVDNNPRFMKSYHKRSNVETAFSMIKRNFGVNLRTRKDLSQVNEIFMKCVCHNLSVLVQESFELCLKIDFCNCAERTFAQRK